MMADAVGVERIGRLRLLIALELEFLARDEGQQMAALGAERAIAFDDFGNWCVGVEFEGDPSAMASALIVHDPVLFG
jgi:hypothetical protein